MNGNIESIKKKIDSSGNYTDESGNLYKDVGSFNSASVDDLKNLSFYGTEADAASDSNSVTMNFDYLNDKELFTDERGRVYAVNGDDATAVGWIDKENVSNLTPNNSSSSNYNGSYRDESDIAKQKTRNPSYNYNGSYRDDSDIASQPAKTSQNINSIGDLKKIDYAKMEEASKINGVGDLKKKDYSQLEDSSSKKDEGILGALKSAGATVAVAAISILDAPSSHEIDTAKMASKNSDTFEWNDYMKNDPYIKNLGNGKARYKTVDEYKEDKNKNLDAYFEKNGLKEYCYKYDQVRSIFSGVKKFIDEPWKGVTGISYTSPIPDPAGLIEVAPETGLVPVSTVNGAVESPSVLGIVQSKVAGLLEGGIDANPAISSVVEAGGPSNIIDAVVVDGKVVDAIDTVASVLK